MSEPARVERLHPLTAMARGWVLLLILVWRAIREVDVDVETGAIVIPERGEMVFLGVLAGAYLVVVVVGGIAVVRHTSFELTEDHLRIDTGWISRTSRVVPYRRIFSVNVTRPFMARVLGLAKVLIDAGEDEPVAFEYLSRQRAETLRDQLLEQGRERREDDSAAAVESDGFSVEDHGNLPDGDLPDPRDGDLLIHLSAQRIGRARLRSFFPLFIVVAVAIAVPLALWAERATWLIAFAVIAAGMVARWVWRIVAAGSVEIRSSSSALTVRTGRFDLSAQSVPLRRVESVTVTQPILWRKPDWFDVTLGVVGGGASDDDSGDRSTVLPVATRAEVRLLIDAIWPGVDLEHLLDRSLPDRARVRYPFDGRHLRWGYTREFLAVRRGWFVPAWTLLSLARLQSVDLDAGPIVRRRSLASINFRMPNGGLLNYVPGVDKDEALTALDELSRIAAKR